MESDSLSSSTDSDSTDRLDPFERIALNTIYELWLTYAEKIFERVVEICELDEEQTAALRDVALRPNDFAVEMK